MSDTVMPSKFVEFRVMVDSLSCNQLSGRLLWYRTVLSETMMVHQSSFFCSFSVQLML